MVGHESGVRVEVTREQDVMTRHRQTNHAAHAAVGRAPRTIRQLRASPGIEPGLTAVAGTGKKPIADAHVLAGVVEQAAVREFDDRPFTSAEDRKGSARSPTAAAVVTENGGAVVVRSPGDIVGFPRSLNPGRQHEPAAMWLRLERDPGLHARDGRGDEAKAVGRQRLDRLASPCAPLIVAAKYPTRPRIHIEDIAGALVDDGVAIMGAGPHRDLRIPGLSTVAAAADLIALHSLERDHGAVCNRDDARATTAGPERLHLKNRLTEIRSQVARWRRGPETGLVRPCQTKHGPGQQGDQTRQTDSAGGEIAHFQTSTPSLPFRDPSPHHTSRPTESSTK